MRKIFWTLCALMCLLTCGCADREYTKSIYAMDTIMDIKIYAENDAAIKAAEGEIKRLDALLDRGSYESDIYKINSEKSAEVSAETADIIRTAVDVSQKSGGAFDITTAPLSDIWGFYSSNFRVPSDSEIENTLKYVGYENIDVSGNSVTIPDGFSIDMGAIAKGYLSDRIADILKSGGISSAIVSLGGNVYAVGKKPDGGLWKVGIADPFDKGHILGTVSVSDKAVVTSGNYQRCFEQDGRMYHHIIDPATGRSAESGLVSVTVISPSGINADALSTALFVMGLDKGAELYRNEDGFEAVFVGNDGSIHVTDGIADAFECYAEFSTIIS